MRVDPAVFQELFRSRVINLCSLLPQCNNSRMILTSTLSRLLALCLMIVATSSCVPTIAGGGGSGVSVAYIAGELQAQEDLSIDEAWPATIRALENLELRVKEQDKDSLSAKAVAYGADDKKVTVRLRREAAGVTSFKIRIGLWGDQAFSMTILDKIEEEAGLGGVPVVGRTDQPAKRPAIQADGPAPVERENLY